FIVSHLDSSIAIIVLRDLAAQKFVTLFMTVTAKGFAMPKLLDRLMHRPDHRCWKRFRHIADAAANDALCYTGVRVAEGFDPPRNLGKQIASLELEIIFIEVRHDNRKKMEGTRSVASSEHETTRRASLQIGCCRVSSSSRLRPS